MVKITYLLFATIMLIVATSENTKARMFRVNQIPNGKVFGCANCHVNPGGGGRLTPFGDDVKNRLVDDNVKWSSELANLDSDSDGFTNGEELMDPDGTWRSGSPDPGNPNNVGNPGDEKSIPIISAVEEFVASSIILAPNPVLDNATLSFVLDEGKYLSIQLIDLKGTTVQKLYEGFAGQGQFSLTWKATDNNGNKLSPGIYFISIHIGRNFILRRIFVL